MNADALDRYLRALVAGDYPAPKEVSIHLSGGNDALADELDRIAGEVGAPGFLLHDGELITWTKPYGNPWALHEALVALRALSERVPSHRFTVELEPDDARGTLQAGVFTGVRSPSSTRGSPRTRGRGSPAATCARR